MHAMHPSKQNFFSIRRSRGGFSFLELMIVLAIVGVVSAAAAFSFSQLSGSQTLDKATLSVIAVLNSAHSMAQSSKDASNFGVRIFKNKVTSFEGSYGTGNTDYPFSNLIAISTSTGIGTDIIFNNLYGNTSASGTIKLYLVASPQTSSTIRVFSTGAIERD